MHTGQESRKKKSESFYILGYLLELIIKFWRFEKKIPSTFFQFSHEKSLAEVEIIIFMSKFGENSTINKTSELRLLG
jgi:hypothetical protein